MEESQFVVGMEKLVSAFGVKLDSKRVDIYMEMLSGIPEKEWPRVVNDAIKTFPKFPSVSELYTLWKQLFPPQGVPVAEIINDDYAIKLERERNLQIFEEMKKLTKEQYAYFWKLAQEEVKSLGLPDSVPVNLLTKFRTKNLYLKSKGINMEQNNASL